MLRAIGTILSPIVFVALIGVAIAAPNGADGHVRGNVVMGPVCPGPERRDQQECAPRPTQATVKVFAARNGDRDARIVTTIVTDREGRFQLTLAPGTYRLVPTPANGVATGKVQEVTVTAGSTTDVRLLIDTGMR